MDKKSLRKIMRAVRKNVPDKEEKSRRIFERVRSLPDYRKAAVIGVYVSMPDEVSTEKIIEDALKGGKTAAVPRIKRNGEMDFVPIMSRKELSRRNHLGIYEPDMDLEPVLPEEIEWMIVPGVAFDKMKHRLGQGGGYYDRYLAKTQCPKTALAFEAQIVEEVPADREDIPMDLVVTEENVY